MVAKWKTKGNLKPEVILEKLTGMKNKQEDGSVSWSGFEYFSATLALKNMVAFPEKVNDFYKGNIVRTALDIIAKKPQALSKKDLIDEINSIIREASKTPFLEFYVLSSLSISNFGLSSNVTIENCQILLLDGDYPQEFANSSNALRNREDISDKTPQNYKKVIVSLKAKSEILAITTALRVLDLQRAIWLLPNPILLASPDKEWEPINKIRLGHVHTVHDTDGQGYEDLLWHEPNFMETQLFTPKDAEDFRQNSDLFWSQLSKLPYEKEMKSALLRFVRALDESDQNIAVIKLWGALEELIKSSNYDLVTRRISFLFTEREYHQQILESLRDYRNRSVHAGEYGISAKSYARTLHYYFSHLVLFHLKMAGKFKDLDEVNCFLDLPVDEKILDRRKYLIEKAMEFRGASD